MRPWLEFKKTWLDKRIDYDRTYGYQLAHKENMDTSLL